MIEVRSFARTTLSEPFSAGDSLTILAAALRPSRGVVFSVGVILVKQAFL
jgi:hypothetical protein